MQHRSFFTFQDFVYITFKRNFENYENIPAMSLSSKCRRNGVMHVREIKPITSLLQSIYTENIFI